MVDYSIRRIKRQEFEEFKSQLEGEELYDNEPWLIREFTRIIVDYEEEETLVDGYFDQNGNLLGLILFSEQSKLDMFGDDDVEDDGDIIYAMIELIFVHPKHRGSGVGRVLVEYALANAKREWIHANPVDGNALHFFQSLGFESDDEHIFTDDDWHQFFHKEIAS